MPQMSPMSWPFLVIFLMMSLMILSTMMPKMKKAKKTFNHYKMDSKNLKW